VSTTTPPQIEPDTSQPRLVGACDQEAGQPSRRGERPDPLPRGDGEPEPRGEDEYEEQELCGEDGLDLAQVAQVQCERLTEERTDHDDEAEQPDTPTEGMGDQTQVQCGLIRGVFNPHSLQDAGDGIRQRRRQGQDVDHLRLHYSTRLQAPTAGTAVLSS